VLHVDTRSVLSTRIRGMKARLAKSLSTVPPAARRETVRDPAVRTACEAYTDFVHQHLEKAQEAASVAAIGQLTKKCPGPRCIYNIEKDSGCDHMTCKFQHAYQGTPANASLGSKCRYEFCWVCLADYNLIRRQGNSAHQRGCKYHSARLA
jgi:hypothetical protein